MTVLLEAFNEFLWVAGNFLGAVIFFSALAFSITYPLLFQLERATAGWRIWRAILSVTGFGLLTFIGIFLDGRVPAWEIPPDVSPWRPIIRIVVYILIAQSFASLVGYIIARRFFPAKIKVAPEVAVLLENDLVTHLGTGPGVPDAKTLAEALVKDNWTKVVLLPPQGDSLNVPVRRFRHRP